MKILPNTRTPELSVETAGHGTWTLSEQAPEQFTLLVFYRGHHCPLCKRQLREFDEILSDFEAQGINVFALSSNSRELAERSVEEWGLENLKVGYGLPLQEALDWGLFLSGAIKDTEPAHFTEPGFFLVRPDGTLFASIIQTFPFSRPPAKQLLSSLSWIIENGYPARGEADLAFGTTTEAM